VSVGESTDARVTRETWSENYLMSRQGTYRVSPAARKSRGLSLETDCDVPTKLAVPSLECQHFFNFARTLSELIGVLMFLLMQAKLSAALACTHPTPRRQIRSR